METFSNTCFMGNCKPQNDTWPEPCGHVCRVQFTLVIYGKVFWTKNCTALRLKVWTSFLHPFAMCLLDFWSRINELLLIFGRLKWCTSTWWRQYGGPKQWRRTVCCPVSGRYQYPDTWNKNSVFEAPLKVLGKRSISNESWTFQL